MSTVSTLLVNLTAKTTVFERGMQRGIKSIKSFKQAAIKSLDFVKRSFKYLAIAALGAMTAIGYMVKRAYASIDKIEKMSTELQISTETLVGWNLAAKLTGSSIEDLHKGIQIFIRRMGEAEHGYGEGVKGLKQLGIAADQFTKLDTAEQVRQIADRISKLPKITDKVSTAFSLFGRQGVQLLNFLNLGAKGLKEVEAEAVKAGTAFSNFDAKKIATVNDNVTKLMELWQGIIDQLAIQISPLLGIVTEKLYNWGVTGGGAVDFVSDKIKGLISLMGILAKATDVLKIIWEASTGVAIKLSKKTTEAAGGLLKIIRGRISPIDKVFGIGIDKVLKKWQDGLLKINKKSGWALEKNIESMAQSMANLISDAFNINLKGDIDDWLKKVKNSTFGPENIPELPGVNESLKNQKADVLSFSSGLIDVKGLRSSVEDKNAKANMATANYTAQILKLFSKFAVLS